MMKYNTHDQDEYLLQSNLLGAESTDELEQLERVAFYIFASRLEKQGFHFLTGYHTKIKLQINKGYGWQQSYT